MKVTRGDVVLVDFPFASGRGRKVRPALVVQNDRDNQRLTNVIIAMITTRTDRARTEATQLLIEVGTPEGRQTGLLSDSAVNCSNLFTIEQSKLLRMLGQCSAGLQAKVNDCLKSAFELP